MLAALMIYLMALLGNQIQAQRPPRRVAGLPKHTSKYVPADVSFTAGHDVDEPNPRYPGDKASRSNSGGDAARRGSPPTPRPCATCRVRARRRPERPGRRPRWRARWRVSRSISSSLPDQPAHRRSARCLEPARDRTPAQHLPLLIGRIGVIRLDRGLFMTG